MKKKIGLILAIGMVLTLAVSFVFSQPSSYIRRVMNYIKIEGKEFDLNTKLDNQNAFDALLDDLGDDMVFMFGDYYPTNEVNILATRVFILLHKRKGFNNMILDIDAQYQKDYDNWLKTGKKDYYFLPYFTSEAEKLLLEYYNSLPLEKKFKILCMKNAAQDEGETFTSREEYFKAGGNDKGYRSVVKDNKYKTYLRKILKERPNEKYFIYTRFTNTTKYSDMKYFISEYERLGTYLNERNEISKGKVFSTSIAIRTGSTIVGENRLSIVVNDSPNDMPYLIESAMGMGVPYFALPLTRGFAGGAMLGKISEGGWQLDSLAPGGGVALMDVIYNKINKRWDYLFYFNEVTSWKR